MITKYLNNKSRFMINIIYLLVFALLLTSCETVSNHKVNTESIKNGNVQISNATHLVLKNGSFVPLENKEVYFRKDYNGIANVIVVKDTKESYVRDTIKNTKVSKFAVNTYQVDSVKEIYVEKRVLDPTKTVFAVLGTIAVAALVLIAIIAIDLSNHPIRSCPYIYSYDGTKYIMDAEPLGGAVCEGLERTDVSRLENLKETDGRFKLIVKNVNDEQQRIDAMKFFSVRHNTDEFTAPDFNRKFFKYINPVKPVLVKNEDGKDITKFFSDKDNVKWFNELPYDTLNKASSSKETITLKFPKPKNAKNAMLLINGGASYFGSNMIKELLDLKGDKVDDWYKSIYPGSDEQRKLFEVMHRDETYYMDIKVADNNTLRNTGIMKSNGPIVDEDVLYPVNLDNHNSEYVEIVLTPQRYFWKFDQINIVYDYEEVSQSDVQQLNITYSKDNNGNDVSDKLNNADKEYYRMPNIGDRTDLSVSLPNGYNKETNDIFVETTGWYDINLKKEGKPNSNMMEMIFSEEGGLYRYAMDLYYKSISNLSNNYNNN